MRDRIYIGIIVVMFMGAVFYAGNAVLGQASHHPNPALAGAKAAKPNAVPKCLASCHGRNSHATSSTMASSKATAVASAKSRHGSASAKAVAIANTTVNVQQKVVQQAPPARAESEEHENEHTTVQHTTVVRPVIKKTTVIQRVAGAPSPVIVTQVAAVPPAPQPLPATGSLATSGILGTSSIIGAGLMYVRSRRRLALAAKRA